MRELKAKNIHPMYLAAAMLGIATYELIKASRVNQNMPRPNCVATVVMSPHDRDWAALACSSHCSFRRCLCAPGQHTLCQHVVHTLVELAVLLEQLPVLHDGPLLVLIERLLAHAGVNCMHMLLWNHLAVLTLHFPTRSAFRWSTSILGVP